MSESIWKYEPVRDFSGYFGRFIRSWFEYLDVFIFELDIDDVCRAQQPLATKKYVLW